MYVLQSYLTFTIVTFIAVLYAGGVKSTIFVSNSPTVRVASISQSHTDMYLEIYNNMFLKDGVCFGKSISEEYKQEIRKRFAEHNEKFLSLTERSQEWLQDNLLE
jgi:hypothetical protein